SLSANDRPEAQPGGAGHWRRRGWSPKPLLVAGSLRLSYGFLRRITVGGVARAGVLLAPIVNFPGAGRLLRAAPDRPARTVNRMLANLRFVLGATLAAALLAVTTLGLVATARMTHQTKVGPLESSRSVAFDDRTDWNQFNDPDGARRFEELTRKAA